MLFMPTYYKTTANDLDENEILKSGIKLILLDADNTLRRHHDSVPCEWVDSFKTRMQSAGITLMIASNSKRENVIGFAQRVGLDFCPLCKKPLPFAVKRIIKEKGFKQSETVIIGDQLFTDILCAKLSGIRSVLVKPIEFETKWHFKLRRALERPILRRIIKNVR